MQRCIVVPGKSSQVAMSPHFMYLQDLASGLDGVMFNDLMENIEWFFNLHDKDKDGFLTKDEVLTLSESFLVSSFKGAVSEPALNGSHSVHLPV
jgi:hypothetical protein